MTLISERRACAIPDPDNDEVIITGGYYTRTTVSIYNKDGYQGDLADLRNGRFDHACSMFDQDGKKVSLINLNKIILR